MPLAYVFWHSPADPASYEERLLRFHAALLEAPPAGFATSASFRTRVPWIRAPAYEDWYVVDAGRRSVSSTPPPSTPRVRPHTRPSPPPPAPALRASMACS